MQNFLSIQQLECWSQLHKYFDGFVFWQSLFGLDIVSESPPIAILINKIIIIIGPEHLYELYYIWMINLRKDADLVIREFTKLWCMFKFIQTHYFDCKKLFSFSMLCSVYIPILTLPDALHQDIVLYDFIHHLYYLIFIISQY